MHARRQPPHALGLGPEWVAVRVKKTRQTARFYSTASAMLKHTINAAVLSDIAMLVYTGGRERTAAEFRALLAEGGFGLTEVTPPVAGSAIRILAAAPA